MGKARFIYPLFVCALAACSDDPPPVAPPLLNGDPIALDQQLVFVDPANAKAYLLDVGASAPDSETVRIDLPPSASRYERRNAHDEALVLCSGRRGTTDQDAAPAALVRIDGEGHSQRYELGTTPFNALTQSLDGRYAIAYRDSVNAARVLDNPNELVVVDLDKAPDDDGAVSRKTPEGLAHPLDKVVISPSMRISEEDRRLLVVLSAAEVTLFDLNHLERRATIVQLDATRDVDPDQVVFSTSNPTMYVRARSSDDVYMFRFESHDNDALGNDFRPTVNPLSGGDGPSDLALFGSGADERLIVLAQRSAQVLVVDPSSSKTSSLKLSVQAQRIMLFEGPSPNDPRVQTRALLYSPDALGISFVDPQELGDSTEDKLESFSVLSPISGGVLSLSDEGKLLLLQGEGVTVLNLYERTLTPLSTRSGLSLAGTLFDAEHKRLWVGPRSELFVGNFDVLTGRTDELRLDSPIQTLVPMFGLERLVVLHPDTSGELTLIDLAQPDREHAVSVHGFFVNGVLDRGDR